MQEKITLNKKILSRLAYIKFILQQGLLNAKKTYPYSTLAILNFHDSVEFFLHLVAESTNSKHTDQLNQYFDNINKNGNGILLAGKNDITTLTKIRNNLKHGGLIPSIDQLSDCVNLVHRFFEENVILVFDKQLSEISIIDLVNLEDIRNYLKTASASYSQNQLKETRINLGIAFWELIYLSEEPFRDYGESPFNFGGDMTFLNSFFMGLKRSDINVVNYDTDRRLISDLSTKISNLGDFVDKVGSSVSKMKDAMRILSLGLDYRKFIRFTSLTPIPQRSLAGTYHTQISSKLAIKEFNQEEFDFCIDFILETYFVLFSARE